MNALLPYNSCYFFKTTFPLRISGFKNEFLSNNKYIVKIKVVLKSPQKRTGNER